MRLRVDLLLLYWLVLLKCACSGNPKCAAFDLRPPTVGRARTLSMDPCASHGTLLAALEPKLSTLPRHARGQPVYV